MKMKNKHILNELRINFVNNGVNVFPVFVEKDKVDFRVEFSST